MVYFLSVDGDGASGESMADAAKHVVMECRQGLDTATALLPPTEERIAMETKRPIESVTLSLVSKARKHLLLLLTL